MLSSNLFKALLLLAAINTSICAMNFDGIPGSKEALTLENLYANTPQLECEKLGKHEGIVVLDALATDDFSYVVSGAQDGSIQIWSCGEVKACLQTIEDAHVGGVLGLQICKTKPLIMSYGKDNKVKVWTMWGECIKAFTILTEAEADIAEACWISEERIAVASGSHIVPCNINTNECHKTDLPMEISSITSVDDNTIVFFTEKKYKFRQGEGYAIGVLNLTAEIKDYRVLLRDYADLTDGSSVKSIGNNRVVVMSFNGNSFCFDLGKNVKEAEGQTFPPGKPFVAPYGQGQFVYMEPNGLVSVVAYEIQEESKGAIPRKIFGQSFPAITAMSALGEDRIVFSSGVDNTIYIGTP